MNATYVLVLVPVRELAVQVHSMIQKLAQFTDVRAALVVGGLSSQVQAATLRGRPEVVVATPGRMIDHLHNTQSVGLEDLQVLVLDEADRLLEMGFQEELREIVRACPKQRQTMLFSATMTDAVKELATLSLKDPVRLAADALEGGKGPMHLKHEVVRVRGALEGAKEPLLLALCTRTFKSKTIIFSGTKQQAHRIFRQSTSLRTQSLRIRQNPRTLTRLRRYYSVSRLFSRKPALEGTIRFSTVAGVRSSPVVTCLQNVEKIRNIS